MNNVSLMGRLTRDPELRYTPEQTSVCRYTLAVANRSEAHPADFINITAWGKGADFARKYFRKGQMVGVQGRIQTGSYTGTDGVKRYTFEVVAERQFFAGSKEQTQEARQEAPKDAEFEVMADDEGLPF